MNAMTEINGGVPVSDIEADERQSAAPKLDEPTNRNWFARQPITKKLAWVYLSQVLLMVTVGAFLWYQLSQIATILEDPSAKAAEGQAMLSSIQWGIAVAVLIGMAMTAGGLHHLSHYVSGSIKNLTEANVKLVRGEKDFEIPYTGRWDEIGEMARSLDVFRRGYFKLDKMRAQAAKKAEEEMEAEKQRQREREEMLAEQARVLLDLADKFERTVGDVVGGVAAASTQLQSTASTMASAAEQAAQQTGEVAKAMDEASSGVTAAAAASDEFAMSINEISRQAATSAELARKATSSASEADATISKLSTSADQVSQIVELISSIAQRTNLLALNASIEAARGGDAGRGFAVVASEVKELATQTSKATDEVAEQVRAMQDSTHASVDALRLVGDQIQQLEATAVSIASAVDQQSVAGQDLARSIDLAARSTDNVSANIAQVRQASESTGSAASQVLNSATELEEQAATLRAQVNEFLTHIRAS